MIQPDYVSPCGSVVLYRGDCLEIMPQLEDTVDCICTDLPYAVTSCKWDVLIPFAPLWASYKRLIKPGGAVVLFGAQPFTTDIIQSNREWFKYCWVWQKSKAADFVNAKNKPMRNHEDIAVFSAGGTANGSRIRMAYYPQGLTECKRTIHAGKSKFGNIAGKRPSHKESYEVEFTGYPTTVLYFPNDGNTIHPTQKPLRLLEQLIRTYTNEGETVLDNTFGSGTAAIACLNTNRKFIGIERDATYFAAAVSRVEAHIAKRTESLFVMEAAA